MPFLSKAKLQLSIQFYSTHEKSGTVLKVAGKITATNRISNATVVYQAAKSVNLQPGFSAIPSESKRFLATIGGCP